jgi:hypothetical protein
MKRRSLPVFAAILALHTSLISVALVVKYRFWGTSASFTAGKIQRLVDLPVLSLGRFILNRPEMPFFTRMENANDGALVREILVFSLIGFWPYVFVAILLTAIFRRRFDRSEPKRWP